MNNICPNCDENLISKYTRIGKIYLCEYCDGLAMSINVTLSLTYSYGLNLFSKL